MLKYLIKRILQSIPLFIVITALVYIVISLAPGGPLSQLSANGEVTEAQLKLMEASLGLDKPVLVRYGLWLQGLLSGDMGVSYRTSQPVAIMVTQRIGPSVILMLSALFLALLAGIPLGVFSALKPYSFVDKFGSVLAFAGTSVPSFLLSLGCIYVFAVQLHVLPAMGMYYSTKPKTLGVLLIHLLLPAVIIALNLMGSIIKQTRGSMLETLKEEYVKTARAKGINEVSVVLSHALRNALIPVVTSVGLMVPYLIGGSVVIEQIFSWPGIGSLLVHSIIARDYPAIMGIMVIISLVVMGANTVLDLFYAYLDPRISKEA